MLFERELRALAEGGELKRWHRPAWMQCPWEDVAQFLGHKE